MITREDVVKWAEERGEYMSDEHAFTIEDVAAFALWRDERRGPWSVTVDEVPDIVATPHEVCDDGALSPQDVAEMWAALKKELLEARKALAEGRRFTPRGFEDFAQLIDSHGNQVTVRESSTLDGHVHLFCHRLDAGVYAATSPYLNAEQAREVACGLTTFAESLDAEPSTVDEQA